MRAQSIPASAASIPVPPVIGMPLPDPSFPLAIQPSDQ
jgi:hypothetical protein